MTYTRSVAVNSMVGYVVGLGDRHSSNILLDKTSAEMIHIDLGVAFEQGKCLKTPETVPFRLTRDVVDGFGACGVEGIMRKCSEETLRVLRANKNALTTVVAVLVHDPILKWAVSPERAAERQREMEEEEEPASAEERKRGRSRRKPPPRETSTPSGRTRRRQAGRVRGRRAQVRGRAGAAAPAGRAGPGPAVRVVPRVGAVGVIQRRTAELELVRNVVLCTFVYLRSFS